jgi:glycosyltransferase involved in cell wall biosynthesis
VYLPRFYGQARLDAITLSLRLKAARDSLISNGTQYVVLYLWRPEFASALHLVRHDLSCYHIDDEYSFSTTSVGTSEDELTLLEQVDQVFIHSGTMLRAKGGINPNTAHVPNGVDYERYSTAADEPADLAGIPRPRIGYIGWLKPQMDWPLVQTLVRRHSNWSFVFIGPEQRQPEVQKQIAQLRQATNVHLLGARPTAVLHAYTQHLDVCLMPYEVNPYTEFIYPVKVHEYLAAGNPVVASPLPNLREFSNVLSLACRPDEWSAAIAAALESRGDERLRSARRLVAQRHDWSALSKKVVSILATRLSQGSRSS